MEVLIIVFINNTIDDEYGLDSCDGDGTGVILYWNVFSDALLKDTASMGVCMSDLRI